jgi:hypothetical protein
MSAGEPFGMTGVPTEPDVAELEARLGCKGVKPSFKPDVARHDLGSSKHQERQERGSDLSRSRPQGDRHREEPSITVLLPEDPPFLSESAAVVLLRLLQRAAAAVDDRHSVR